MTLKIGYLLAAVALLVIEVLIASFLHGGFIRLYFGDYLVVILLYCLVRAVTRLSVLPAALGVLIFSFTLETLQYFHLVRLLGLESFRLARVILGDSFEWQDLLAYAAGIGTVLIVEKLRRTSR